MTACPDREPMLQALLDGELDAANAAATEAHLKTCAGCAAQYRMLQALRARLGEAELSPPAPAHLRRRIEAMIEAEGRKAPARRPWWTGVIPAWSTAGAMALLAASLMVVQVIPQQQGSLGDQLVASHVRSLMEQHLIDVATSDRHVVRPWFAGKVDFTPPVVDLADQGFPLVGGRLDYAGDRTVAALVYRRHAHVINLFVMPARDASSAWRIGARKTSYSVIHWTHGELDFWAVSDLEKGELEQFHKTFAARAPS
jgi:anti-sigma factor RsiW